MWEYGGVNQKKIATSNTKVEINTVETGQEHNMEGSLSAGVFHLVGWRDG